MAENEPQIGRRALLEWAAASAALAACARAPVRKIVPYVVQPPEIVPGRPLHYATAWELDGYGMGLVALSHTGRPTKIEGNPKHPASLGATRAIDQALIETLYEPDRARGVESAGEPVSLHEFDERVAHKRVAVLMPPTSSRAIEKLVRRIRSELPGSDVWFHTPLSRANVWAAGKSAFGEAVEPMIDPSKARAIVTFSSDFLASGPSCVRAARKLADKRAADGARLWAIESRRTPTGVFADERVATGAHDRARFACAIAARVLSDSSASDASRALATTLRERAGDVDTRFADRCARDLLAARGAAAWVVGDAEPMELHALAWLVNRALGAVGGPIVATPSPILEAGERSHDLADFSARAASGDFDLVVIAGVNPVYSAPDFDLARSLAGAKDSAYVGLHRNETAALCRWLVPLAHTLESWGDVRADDGTGSIVQPLIDPIFGGITIAEVLARVLGDLAPSGHDLTRDALGLDDGAWNDALQSGVLPSTSSAPTKAAMNEDALVGLVQAWVLPVKHAIEIELHPSHAVHDGRFATPLLLELPEPLTKSTWGNVALVSRATAESLGVGDEDVVKVTAGSHSIELPALIERGQPDGVLSIALGWGRRGAERLADGVGANAFLLREALEKNAPTAIAAGRSEPVARTQINIDLYHRAHEIARSRLKSEKPLAPDTAMRLSLYTPQLSPTAPHAWAMSIDMSRCTGCQACVAACNVENNVPTVGKAGVLNDRDMHWLRIDHYEGDRGVIFQPMLCQHCDDAPCEYVCPVNATVHSPDGLNEMVYNRCVGTRFCSNNCPYKVRRFNWFNYHEDEPALRQLEHNPQVTVRARGVMEKCTFCVQRIRDAEHVADSDHRALARDEVVTACQQVCPTQAIVFGDKNDPNSAVSLRYGLPEAYAVLDDLGTRPRIRYLPKVIDKSPERA
ncbi:MAG TPA: 4Fe-4S dicluster domain-containing protein [Polyangiaceae bacterium]|jgi:molybdopterin-containing oxidoreductase family iron-sulfur binding subunit